MKPEYLVAIDESKYVYAKCNCPLSSNWAIKIPREPGKIRYGFSCEICKTEGFIYTK